MTDNGQPFRIIQSIDTVDKKRTVEFIIDRANQHILLQISENDNIVLSIVVRRQISSEQDVEAHYKLTIELERNIDGLDKKIRAEIIDYVGKVDEEFSWLDDPDDVLLSQVHSYTINDFVNMFIRDVLSLLTSSITLRKEER